MSNVIELNSRSKNQELIVFQVGDLNCSLPIQEIQEVIEPPSITEVAMGKPEIEGLINLRGRIVTIINMRVRCGSKPVDVTKTMRIIAIEMQGELMGLLVDKIEDFIHASEHNIIPVPSNTNSASADIFRSVYKQDDQLIGILDLEKTLLGVS